MPGANEVLGCPRIFSILLVVHKIYSNSSHKISIFSIFRIRFQISRKFASWVPTSAASCPGNDIFSLPFQSFTYIFVRKLAPWMPWAVAPSEPPLCTPLIYSRFIWQNETEKGNQYTCVCVSAQSLRLYLTQSIFRSLKLYALQTTNFGLSFKIQ